MDNLNININHSDDRPIATMVDDIKIEIVNCLPQQDLNYIINLYRHNKLSFLDLLGEGANGVVYEYEDYAIKLMEEFTDPSESNDIEALKDLQHLDCIPTLYAVVNDELLIMEKIRGLTVEDYFEDEMEYFIKIDSDFVKKWDNALIEIIKEGYTPDDLHPKNVMIEIDTMMPKIVDLGWFYKHNEDHSESSIEDIKDNRGYKRAEYWTGRSLRSLISETA